MVRLEALSRFLLCYRPKRYALSARYHSDRHGSFHSRAPGLPGSSRARASAGACLSPTHPEAAPCASFSRGPIPQAVAFKATAFKLQSVEPIAFLESAPDAYRNVDWHSISFIFAVFTGQTATS